MGSLSPLGEARPLSPPRCRLEGSSRLNRRQQCRVPSSRESLHRLDAVRGSNRCEWILIYIYSRHNSGRMGMDGESYRSPFFWGGAFSTYRWRRELGTRANPGLVDQIASLWDSSCAHHASVRGVRGRTRTPYPTGHDSSTEPRGPCRGVRGRVSPPLSPPPCSSCRHRFGRRRWPSLGEDLRSESCLPAYAPMPTLRTTRPATGTGRVKRCWRSDASLRRDRRRMAASSPASYPAAACLATAPPWRGHSRRAQWSTRLSNGTAGWGGAVSVLLGQARVSFARPGYPRSVDGCLAPPSTSLAVSTELGGS